MLATWRATVLAKLLVCAPLKQSLSGANKSSAVTQRKIVPEIAHMSHGLSEETLKEFYQHVFPVEEIVQWLSYATTPTSTNDDGEGELTPEQLSVHQAASTGYLARREFCFTLLGDIFTRFRSYASVAELRQELVHRFPEKIDVGAVYNVRPNQKQQTAITPLERELVFDIDMSDYDKIRSCCQGKSICGRCWAWMSCAAKIMQHVLSEDFGFKYLLPIFSGRRGIHLWVCDKRARRLTDDERGAIVGYMSVATPTGGAAGGGGGGHSSSHNVVYDLVNRRAIHPTLAEVQKLFLAPAFQAIFIDSDASNPNSVQHVKGAAIVFDAVATAVKHYHRKDAVAKFHEQIPFEAGVHVLDWDYVLKALGDVIGPGVVAAVQFMLLYPRLDEHVSTHRDHLLKLPFCVHPGTGRLCTPLRWEILDSFDPTADPPTLTDMLETRTIEGRWRKPLLDMLADMSLDRNEW